MGAISTLSGHGVDFIAVSGLWQSPAWPPGQGHPDYLNAVAKVNFKDSPKALLKLINDVEAKFGRIRSQKNAPRTLDLDILDFAAQRYDDYALTLPHPRMLSRGFVLFPLQEIAPWWQDPLTTKPIEYFIARLPLEDVAPMKYMGSFCDC